MIHLESKCGICLHKSIDIRKHPCSTCYYGSNFEHVKKDASEYERLFGKREFWPYKPKD